MNTTDVSIVLKKDMAHNMPNQAPFSLPIDN
jgi:hypothetical protein